MDAIKAKLLATFKMNDLGAASYILGIQITRDRKARTISLSQQQYIKRVVEQCGMADRKAAYTPMAPGIHLMADNPDGDNTTILKMEINGHIISYAAIMGSIMYTMMDMHPDLAYTVGILGRFSSNPKVYHWEATKHTL